MHTKYNFLSVAVDSFQALGIVKEGSSIVSFESSIECFLEEKRTKGSLLTEFSSEVEVSLASDTDD